MLRRGPAFPALRCPGLVCSALVLAQGIGADQLHRRRGAQVGGRGHRGDMTGIQDVGAGAGGTGAAGCDIAGDGNWRGDDFLDDLAHGAVQAAGGVDADQDQLYIAGGSGAVQAAFDIVAAGRANGAVELQLDDSAGFDDWRRFRLVLGVELRGREDCKQQHQGPGFVVQGLHGMSVIVFPQSPAVYAYR